MGDSCEVCGWTAAVLAMLAFGSFGVPIKSNASRSVDIDPLVFQSYKTFMCFVTSWLVLLLGQDFSYTPWGIVSGFFWVPGGVAMVYAIKAAGLAVAMGVGSSFIVLVSFTWGIFVFGEKVESRVGASFAIVLMMAGLWGMSYYSSAEAQSLPHEMDHHSLESRPGGYFNVHAHASDVTDVGDFPDEDTNEENITIIPTTAEIPFCGKKMSKRKLGLAAAFFNGAWGGSIMVPMKFAPADANGMGFVISFAIGASIVTLFLWLMRYGYHLGRTRSLYKAYQALPSFHIPVMWLPGGTSGILWSAGNFFSIISVEHLGEGVGYSVVQASMLVSGLWGIFFFRELVDGITIAKWFVSAGLTISGILLLSYEHHKA